MIIELRAKNCYSFYDEIAFSMKADMRSSKFASNVYRTNHFNILKTAGIYGPNNVGKTCLVKCVKSVREALLNRDFDIMPNLFHKNPICELGITFLWKGREFSYDFRYHVEKKEYPYEKFSEILKDKYGNEKEIIWLLKDTIDLKYEYEDKELLKMIPLVSQSNLLMYMLR